MTNVAARDGACDRAVRDYFGGILDGSTVHVTAGTEGLIVGDRVIASRRDRPAQAVVH